MSILIPGMEMPASCNNCRFSIDGFCYASGRVNIGAVEEMQTANYCPLIPVPEHGALIDRDALMENARYKGTHDIVTAWDIVAAPTIIPADKEGQT